jgi:hypothetical protein
VLAMDLTFRSPTVVLNSLPGGFFSGMIEEAGLCYRRGWGYFPDFDVVHALFFFPGRAALCFVRLRPGFLLFYDRFFSFPIRQEWERLVKHFCSVFSVTDCM